MIGPLDETDVWTKKENEKTDFIFLLRVDHESLHNSKRNVEEIKKIMDNNIETRDLSFELVDWQSWNRFYDDSTEDLPGPQFKYKVGYNLLTNLLC